MHSVVSLREPSMRLTLGLYNPSDRRRATGKLRTCQRRRVINSSSSCCMQRRGAAPDGLPLRVHVPKYKVATQSHNYDNSLFGSFGPIAFMLVQPSSSPKPPSCCLRRCHPSRPRCSLVPGHTAAAVTPNSRALSVRRPTKRTPSFSKPDTLSSSSV